MVKTFPWCITQNQWLLSTIMGLQKEDPFRSSQNRASCHEAGKNSLMVFNEEPEKWRNYLRIGDFNLHDNLSNLRINSERKIWTQRMQKNIFFNQKTNVCVCVCVRACVWVCVRVRVCMVCEFCLFTLFLSPFFVFHKKNLVLLGLISRYQTSTSNFWKAKSLWISVK